MHPIILGDGPMGHALAARLAEHGIRALRVLGRPPSGRRTGADLADADVVFDFSRGSAVLANVQAALSGGCRALVIGTTGWEGDRAAVAAAVEAAEAVAVTAPNFSLGVALFGLLVERAGGLFAALPEYDPFIFEWHRRTKADRPSGTAKELTRRLSAARRTKPGPGTGDQDPLAEASFDVVSLRAGSSPGMHLVGFDAPGETIELRLTARDRSAYAAGAQASAEWLLAAPRPVGVHPFEAVLVDLLAADRPVPMAV